MYSIKILEFVMLLLSVCGARETRAGAVAERATVSWRVAPNAADVHAKIVNAKDNRFKRNPFYCSPYFIIKKWLVQVGSVINPALAAGSQSASVNEARCGGGFIIFFFYPPPI